MLALVFAANLPSLQNGFVWDDAQNVINNGQLHSWDGLWRIWTDPHATQQYYPLVQTSWWIETQLWGTVPLHFHVLNIALHALAALLLWACLRVLALPGSWLAAALFALHPVQVESVAWVTERKNVLCGVFFFAGAYCLLRVLLAAPETARAPLRLSTGRGTRPSRPAGKAVGDPPSRGWYAAGLVLFVCAMFSKTVACTLPVSLLVLVWWKRGAIARRDALLIAPLVPFGVGLGLFTAHLEREHAGAEGATWAFSWAERCLIAGRALWFYLQSVLWPGERVFIPRRWHIDAGDAAQYVYPIAVLVLFAALWRLRARIGRGPLAAALIYAITLFPALGFFNVYSYKFSFAYDHFQYLAVPAPLALLSAAVVTRVRALAATPQSIAIVAAALVLAACGALTWRQSCIYQNPETLWRHTLRWNPDCWLGHRNLANAALAAGHTDEAIAELRAALRLDGRDAEGHNNLGVAYGWKGKRDESIAEFKRALAVDPKFLPTYRNLAIALALAGREDEARKVLAFQQKISQPAAGYSSSARP